MKKKEIKFTSLTFNEIGEDGLIHHDYRWDKIMKTLHHYIDGVEIENWNEKEAVIVINKIISSKPKVKTKQTEVKQKIVDCMDDQLTLF